LETLISVQTGIERLLEKSPEWLGQDRIGLLANIASVDRHFNLTRDLLNKQFPGQLTTLFSPQHGFTTNKQANMIESEDSIDPEIKIPVFSLYSQTRKPTKQMYDRIDTLIIDLQDVGTRVYTYIYTMAYCMEAARDLNKKVLILDRPNPINGLTVEGNCLKPEHATFVGRYPIPMRHGLTIGELALLFNDYFGIGCNLEIIPMQGWQRGMYYQDTGLPWIAPSPNLPTPTSTMVYPGQVLWEATNISEGRGTTLPFELFGAPFISTSELSAHFDHNLLEGIHLRPTNFEPVADKWQTKSCNGFQIHITDLNKYQPYRTTLHIMQTLLKLYHQDFQWRKPPYEYEYNQLPIDILIGDQTIRKQIESMEDIKTIEKEWLAATYDFKQICQPYYLYNN
jgi:uncharacterized protein YbbC (DUF1343 family)